MQAKQTIGDVGVIAFFMSRIQMDRNCFFYKVMLYEDNLYMVGHKVDFRFDISNVFSQYQNALEALYDAPVSAFYKGRQPEIKAAFSQFIPYFNMYAVNLLRAAAQDTEVIGNLEEIRKRENFYIIQSEIYEQPYLIYTTNPKREVTA